MSDELSDAIRRAIEDHGPIPFSEFMELALYGPGGFYEHPPIGREGAFVTSPHVHHVFADLLSEGLRGMWGALGQPDPYTLMEVGAGDGTLAGQLLERLTDLPVEYDAIDRSPGARDALARLPIRVHATLEAAPTRICGSIFANELLDNLPFHRVRWGRKGPVEIRIDGEGDRFVGVETPCSDELLEELESLPELPRRGEWVIPVAALHLIDRIGRVLHRGFVLLIDYEHVPGAPVHGYRKHQVVEDVLDAPGSSDITAAVDFNAIAARARGWGLEPAGPFSQRAALQGLGFDSWNLTQRERQAQDLGAGRGVEAVRAWAGRSEASLLVDPSGLGSLRWLLLRTGDCTWPEWVATAELMDRQLED